jgi:hypothetical protein
MGSTGVVHLVWGPLGTAPLRRFARSYREHPAGAAHELVVLLNGVRSAQRAELLAELHGIDHRVVEVPEPIQDLAAYAHTLGVLEHERLCFLNSHSELLAAGWLAKLERALDQRDAGLVGATGSWASAHSVAMHSLFLPSGYRGVFPPKRVLRAQFREIELERDDVVAPADARPSEWSALRTLQTMLRMCAVMPAQLLRFERFPAHHLRTNAFMAERELLRSLQFGRVARKLDAYLLENGRHSLTRQVQRRGLRVLVADRDGAVYDQEQWPLSRTLWQRDQEGLMVADNQTRSYAHGDMERRRLLSAFAWGRQADPRPPQASEYRPG